MPLNTEVDYNNVVIKGTVELGVKGERGLQGFKGDQGPPVPVAHELGDDPELAVSQKLLTDSIADMEQSNSNAVLEATQEANRSEQEADRSKREADRAEKAADDLSGPYEFVGDYAPAITLTKYKQLVRDENGEFWRVSGQVDLPYVTTGAGIPEDDALVPVGDAVLRQDLTNPDKGAAMVGFKHGGSGTSGRTLSDRLDEVMSVKDFGAIGDGVSSDTAALAAGFAAAVSLNRPIRIPPGSYLVDSRINLPHGGRLHVVSEGGATIIGSASPVNLFNADACNIQLEGLRIEGFRYVIEYINASSDAEVELHARQCDFIGNSIVIRGHAAQTHEVSFGRIVINDCTFDGNRYDVMLLSTGYGVKQVQVTNSRFINGGPESLNFQGKRNNDEGDYIFANNLFKNYTNNLLGPDADGHFIRCYGRRATIIGNIFDGLYIAEGTASGDTEALRPWCDEIIVTGNVFRDSGMAEAVVTLKSGRNSIVSNNIFECTDAYNAMAEGGGFYTVAVLADYNTKVFGNTFINFTGAVVDTQDGIPNLGTIEIKDNLIIDCRCTMYSGQQVFRLTAPHTKFVVSGNVVKVNEEANKLPVNMFRCPAIGSSFLISDNDFTCTGHVFFDGFLPDTDVTTRSNTFRGATRIFGLLYNLKSLRMTDDILIRDVNPPFESILGGGEWRVSDVVIKGLTMSFAQTTAGLGRYLGVGYLPDNIIGHTTVNATFRDSNGSIAVQRQSRPFDNTSGTLTVGAATQDEFQSTGGLTKKGINVISNLVVAQVPSGVVNPTTTYATFDIVVMG